MDKPFDRMEIEPTDDGGFQIEVTPVPKKNENSGDNVPSMDYGQDKRYIAKNLTDLTACIEEQCGGAPDTVDGYMNKGNKTQAMGAGNDVSADE